MPILKKEDDILVTNEIIDSYIHNKLTCGWRRRRGSE